MNKKQFDKYLDRDQGCLHCSESEALSPNHRVNRGMGGSKILDRPSNVVVLCSEMNNLIESNPFYRDLAIMYGWKLERYQKPEDHPVFDSRLWKWFLLDNEFGRTEVTNL